MTDGDFQEFNSAGKMTDLVAANNDVFKNTPKALEMNTALETDIGILEAAGAKRVSANGMRSDGSFDAKAAKGALEDFLRKIASNAKTIKTGEADFNNTFKIKRGYLSSQYLLDLGRGFKTELTPPAVAAQFVEYGYLSATPANIQTKIDNLEAARAEQNTGAGSGIAATAETKAAVKRLMKNRRILKTIGENILEENGDAGLIAEWKSVCRIARREKKNTPPKP
jgi:hypothetical protein